MKIIFIFIISLSTFAQSFKTPNGDTINLRLAISIVDQTKGLSGLKSNQFSNNEGMLFAYDSAGPRRFWMPDTYFDLDIYFLDEKLNIIAAEKNVPAHPGRNEPPFIYQTGTYIAWHVLELKTTSDISKKLKVGDQLKWSAKKPLSDFLRK